MRRGVLVATLLLALLAPPGGAGAGGPGGLSVRGRFSGSDTAVGAGIFGGAALLFGAAGSAYRGPGWRDEPAFLIVDATPPDAQVYLDGRRLGTAGELVARALPVSHGPHVVHVTGPGFRPWVARFVADGSFPVRVRATLAPE
jgi:hypothetical protein